MSTFQSPFPPKGMSNTVVTCLRHQPQEQEFNRLKSGKRKNRHIDDAYLIQSQLFTHDDHTVENSHAIEIPSTKVEEHSPNEEEHNKRQHKSENEVQHLLKEAQRNLRSTFSELHVSKATFTSCNFMFYIYFCELIHAYFSAIIITR